MFAVLPLCLLFVSLQSLAAEADLSPPRDLKVIAFNTYYTLTWDWDPRSAGSDPVTFTVQYAGNHQLKKKYPKWSTACSETSQRSCDLTGSNLHYLGIYMLRVRANMNGSHSAWESKQFCPDKEAAIGPPSKVWLAATRRGLDINITDPKTSSNSSMREHISDLKFHILYWEQSEVGKVLMPKTLNTKLNFLTLSNLRAWTLYCVRVQSRYDFYNKTSSFSSPVCIQTEGVTPWWKIFLYFLGSLLIFFLLMLVFLYGGHQCFHFCKAILFPGEKLPPLLKKESDYPRLLVSDSDLDLCDPVIVCPNSAVLEINVDPVLDSSSPPAGLEQENSGRHSRQNSNTSGDSGVYSAGGNSGALRPNSAASFPDLKHRLGCENLNMLSISSEFKASPVIPDEGVVDMEV